MKNDDENLSKKNDEVLGKLVLFMLFKLFLADSIFPFLFQTFTISVTV